MLPPNTRQKHYQALLTKDRAYDGVFYVGVTTTGVFCRPSCPARKPKFEHCQFFKTAKEALASCYRPCKRCQPLSPPHQVSKVVRRLVQAIEENPEKRWKASDFSELSTNAAQASRVFKKRFGMTFVSYARARRMGLALKRIKEKHSVIDAQLDAGYGSGSGFCTAFSKTMGVPPVKAGKLSALKADWLDTPLGPMVAIADEEALYLLEFVDRRGLERELETLCKKIGSPLLPGKSGPIASIEDELRRYFDGSLRSFRTPINLIGSPFQREVWRALQQIPMGERRSYSDIAAAIGRPAAMRAVARANGANQLSIVVPCHRVIHTTGNLGGYGGGLSRKQWLLDHERTMKKNRRHA